jgi:hypothetical protein
VNYDIDLFEQLNEEYRERPIHNTANVAARRQMLARRNKTAPRSATKTGFAMPATSNSSRSSTTSTSAAAPFSISAAATATWRPPSPSTRARHG